MMNKLAKQKKDVKAIMFTFGCAKELAEDMVFNGGADPAIHTAEIIEYFRTIQKLQKIENSQDDLL